ncbi:APC family permease [Millisia brevis]|uniref:APC family permease n=1 Tax=Millisia brevis TaxID=264148 RepID=UPI001FDEF541
MIGAGIFTAPGFAAQAAGAGVLIALAVAAVIAYCNAMSSARLAARYPASGGTYVYGRERLGPFWGYLAGWAFVTGKTASCVAMAMTVGMYLWPNHAHVVAVVTVMALTAVNYAGVRLSAWLARSIVAAVLVVLAAVVAVGLTGDQRPIADLGAAGQLSVVGVLQGAGLLFFAFAGYARITTLGEEVRDPARTIRRAVPIALGVTLAVYAAVISVALLVLGSQGLAAATAPLSAVVTAAGAGWLEPVVRIGAGVAAAGSLLALLLGVSRTVLAMSRDGHFPRALAVVDPRGRGPRRAELVVGVVVAVVAAGVDLRTAIGFSSFGVLLYYTIANVSAWTLDDRPRSRIVPALGVVGCLTVAVFLPATSVIAGAVVLLAGVVIYAARRSGGRS